MRRGSLIGPLVLIVIGTLFLLHNFLPGWSVLATVGDWWPLGLIAWGVLRIAEITSWKSQGRPMPQNGLSGGEWTFVVFLCLFGSALFTANKYRDRWPVRINTSGLEVLGESFDYPQETQTIPGAGKTPRVLVENFRGNARIVGADTEEVRASGRLSVRSYQQSDADKVNKDCKLEVVRQGDLIVIRTNQDRAGTSAKVSGDLEITVPKGAAIETRGRYGDWEITDIAGAIVVDSDNAGVRINNAGGTVKVDTRNSDIIRVVNARSSVDISGRGEDVELDTIAGQATIKGSYRGEMLLRNLARPVRVEESRGELRCERIAGTVNMSRGELSGTDLVGPVIVRGQSKDVQLTNFTDSLEVSVDRGDLEIRPGRLPLGKIEAKTRAGNISLSLPEAAKFTIDAVTERGEADNSWGDPLRQDRRDKGARIEGAVGTGGAAIQLHTDRGRVSVDKGNVVSAPMAPAPPAAPDAPATLAPPAPPRAPAGPPKVESL